MSFFYSRFLECCNVAGKSPSRVALDVGTSKTAVTRWKGGAVPPDSTVLKLSEYFNVNFLWLKGETDEKKPAPKGDEQQIADLLDKLDRAQLLEVIAKATEILRDK